jgi:hypothetical protein
MIKIKAFNVVLVLAAFAALFFLLPPDSDVSNVSANQIESSDSQPSITKKANQQQSVRGHFLHSA